MSRWHALDADDVLREMDVGRDGLTPDDARGRLREAGPNRIRSGREISPLQIFLDQFRDFLIYLLLLAALLSVAVGFLPGGEPEYVEAALILAIVVANGVFGFVQDFRAEKAMDALQELSAPDATVIRDGEKRQVDARDLVPGDVLVLAQGDVVPADARVLEAHALETMEAALTGESGNVAKDPAPVEEEAPLPERASMVYMNTSVVRGRGLAVVVATAMETRVGSIAASLEEAEDRPTPFQEEVDRLGRRIGYGILGLILIVAVVQLAFTEAAPMAVLLVAVTLAVAAVPEGLPAVVTLTLALGARRMSARNALVRRLPVVESLGSVDVIVTDKTGTLTENRMTVERLWSGGRDYGLAAAGGDEGGVLRDGEPVDVEEVEALLRCGALCNDAEPAGDDGYRGDPTEIALLVAASRAGVEVGGERLAEVPFSSERKRMTVVTDGDAPAAWMKGAPEVVLDRCDRILWEGEPRPLDEGLREAALERNGELASDAYRVLGMARKEVDDPDAPEEELESGLVFLGLQAMIDPPREEVPGAVEDCRKAGIRVVMVTGDNLQTARAVGRAAGFSTEGAKTGRDLDGASEEETGRLAREVDVFARVSPEHKVRLLRALQRAGHRVAMTGDGVNDAPALRNADVGVAMGVRGTEVAKEASDMVLQDDDFATIRDAVAEGRAIFDNIRKFVNFLLSANAGEVLAVFFGVLVGSAFFHEVFADRPQAVVLTPVMLLWINLVTDGLPALALGVDPRAEDIMERPPRGRDEPVIDRRVATSVVAMGTLLAGCGLALFFHVLRDGSAGGALIRAQTLLFTFIVAVEMVIIQVIRGRHGLGAFSNRWLVAAVLSTLGLQAAVLYTPLAGLFQVVPPGAGGWTGVGAAFAAFLALAVAAEGAVRRMT